MAHDRSEMKLDATEARSTFVKMLSEHVTDCGLTKNEIIRQSGVERATFFRIVSGRRLPTQQQLERIVQVMGLPVTERTRLYEEYMKLSLGEEEWNKLKAVRAIIETLAESDDTCLSGGEKTKADAEATAVVRESDEKNPAVDQSSQISCEVGMNHVFGCLSQLVDYAFAQDDGRLSFFVPMGYAPFYDMLKTKLGSAAGKRVHVCQILQFPTEKTNATDKIMECISRIIYFLINDDWDYQACYYYENMGRDCGMATIFPYYLLAGGRVLLLSEDVQQAVLIQSGGMYDVMARKLAGLVGVCTPLRAYVSYPEMLMQTERPGKKISLESIPCAAMVARPEYIRKYMTDSDMSGFIWSHCKRLQEEDELIVYSTWDGLRRFAETGIVEEIPPGIMGPMDVPDRVAALMDLREHINHDFYIIDETKMPVSGYWLMTLYADRALYIYPRIATGTEKVIVITEKTVVAAFTAYLKNYGNSSDIVDRDTILERLNGLIDDTGRAAGTEEAPDQKK